MFKPKTFSNLAGALALATCSVLATAPAWGAAEFPTGVYATKSATITFDDKGQYRVKEKEALKVEGAYTVKGEDIQLTDKSGPRRAQRPGRKRARTTGSTTRVSSPSPRSPTHARIAPTAWRARGRKNNGERLDHDDLD
jgi:hypothetical protein